ncbi:GntR family transcriptional repressor for pyruvate dehydrogenase complex [Kitasatospora sp. MAP12-15]|uniref:FadR/GntR family transcriptional regulator n=1 Tax=unclassified Kitasatospora TaxID=2633591 RepID=UPI0024771E5C|nr:FadR/GntR family transcriptional regulator [Kitasatospora sp. MAP12-44]MDH6115410.1 GntR family transcriptional repressor for pyruvate dehydrogenase complex [Kitasatospora sp. MAP12-44]
MTVTDQAIERIKEMIVSGALRPGARLPNESDLSEQLGLSRSSLREAVRALTAMRILVAKQGDGTYVSGLEPHLLLEAMTFAADVSHGHNARQLLQVRRLLEPQAAALAAGLLTAEQLATLAAVLDRSAEAAGIEEFVELDIEFHRTIADAVGNPVLSTLLGILSTHTQRLRIIRGTSHTAARERAHREHQAIWRALASRDAVLAAGASAVHVAAVEDWLTDGAGPRAAGLE